jgi:hypothetical protein
MTQISWTLFKEVMYRWRSRDMNLSVRDRYQGWMTGEPSSELWGTSTVRPCSRGRTVRCW